MQAVTDIMEDIKKGMSQRKAIFEHLLGSVRAAALRSVGEPPEDKSERWGVNEEYDLEHFHNPYHSIIKKAGYAYKESAGGSHTYVKDDKEIAVKGNTWTTSDGLSGSHPNTARAGADLERHLAEAFGGLTGEDVVGRVKELAAEAKLWIDKARWASIRHETSRTTSQGKKRFPWAQNMSDEDMNQQLFDINDMTLRVTDKKKYVLIDVVSGSSSQR